MGPTETQIPQTGKVLVENIEYEMTGGEYKWIGKNTEARRLDVAPPSHLADEIESILTEKNSHIEIVIEQNPELTVYLWNEDERLKEITLKDNQFTAPSAGGRYIYEVRSNWINGEASFVFVIEIN